MGTFGVGESGSLGGSKVSLSFGESGSWGGSKVSLSFVNMDQRLR
jgi:hypothetical protein